MMPENFILQACISIQFTHSNYLTTMSNTNTTDLCLPFFTDNEEFIDVDYPLLSEPPKESVDTNLNARNALAESMKSSTESCNANILAVGGILKALSQTMTSSSESFNLALEALAQTLKSSSESCNTKIEAVDEALKSLVQTSESCNAKVESIDGTMKSLAQTMHVLSTRVTAMRNDTLKIKDDLKFAMDQERKESRLIRAITLTHPNSFIYYPMYHTRRQESSQLAKQVLEWFLLGDYGYDLPPDAVYKEDHLIRPHQSMNSSSEKEKLDATEAFRDKFVHQIKALIGHEPRVVKRNGKFTIYYI